mmetsp:Transcript_114299/g.330178  ORF Transcript_114299/g.330178 Transcript_114299/m.330178 type:complete len:215 (+) Transcript_114299:682-1326(+)
MGPHPMRLCRRRILLRDASSEGPRWRSCCDRADGPHQRCRRARWARMLDVRGESRRLERLRLGGGRRGLRKDASPLRLRLRLHLLQLSPWRWQHDAPGGKYRSASLQCAGGRALATDLLLLLLRRRRRQRRLRGRRRGRGRRLRHHGRWYGRRRNGHRSQRQLLRGRPGRHYGGARRRAERRLGQRHRGNGGPHDGRDDGRPALRRNEPRAHGG